MRLRTFLLVIFAYLLIVTSPLWALNSDVQEYLRDKLDKILDIRLYVSPPTEKDVIQLGYPVTGNIIVGDAQFACAHDGDTCGCIDLPLSLQNVSIDDLITLVNNEPLTAEQQAACDTMEPKWLVAQSRYGPTRPLYDIETDKSFERAPVGMECGDFFKDSNRGRTYRKVSLNNSSTVESIMDLNLMNGVNSIPESSTIVLDSLGDVKEPIKATISMAIKDVDFPDEGEMIINGNEPMQLFSSAIDYVGADGVVSEITFKVPVDWLYTDKENNIVLTHSRTQGFIVKRVTILLEGKPIEGYSLCEKVLD